MKTSSIKAGGVYAGGKNGTRRQVVLVWLYPDDPKAEMVRYVDEKNRLHDVSRSAFARWATRKIKMQGYVRCESQFPRKEYIREEINPRLRDRVEAP